MLTVFGSLALDSDADVGIRGFKLGNAFGEILDRPGKPGLVKAAASRRTPCGS
jgi:hypothetical protein